MYSCNKENSKVNLSRYYHGYEYFIIFRANAIIYPYAVMIEVLYTSIALPTML